MAAKEGLQEKLSAVLPEQQAQEQASYWTGMAIKDFQVTKDNGGWDGNFEDFANQFYALNRLRIMENGLPRFARNDEEMTADEVEEIWNERLAEVSKTMSDEERYLEEQGWGKLFSKSVEETREEEIQQKVFAKDVQNVISEAEKKIPDTKVKAGFGVAKNWLVTVSKRLGLDVEGYKHIVDARNVRHILNRHGEGNETRENQIPVTNQDIENIPNVVNSPDYLVYGTKTDTGREGIGYLKTISDGSTYYVEEVRDKDKQLAAKTMYKIEGVSSGDLVNATVERTSETTPSAVRLIDKLKKSTVVPAFTRNIASGNIDVKGDNKLYSKEDKIADINTPEFKKWFGDSKVVDEKGKPLVVYHGTLNNFDSFSKEMIGSRYVADSKGFFFIDKENIAKYYASSEFDADKKGTVIPVYISAQKPLVINAEWTRNNGLGSTVFDKEDAISFWDNYQFLILEEIENNKNDGVIIDDGNTKMVVAFEPNQIKSVYNRGTFDKEDHNILHSEAYDSRADSEIFGSYDPAARMVELMTGHNPSTLTHELSHHFFMSHIKLMEEMGLNDRNKPVFDWLSQKGGHEINSIRDMQRADWENMSEAFIEYMNTNEAPNLVTKNIFQRAKEWLLDNYRIHRTEASPEIREYFDSLITRDTAMPDVSALANQIGQVSEVLRQAQKGESATFRDVGKREIADLQRALHTRIRRKGLSLKDELIAAGGIKEGTELAKTLGFDVLKKDKMYTNKETAISKEDELIEWLADKGYITPVQEGETAENQIPVTNQDIEDIPSVVNSPDFLVYGGKTERGRNTIGYLKTISDGSTYYVEEVRDKSGNYCREITL